MALWLIDDPLAPWYWPRLPKGRRPRKLEHARRARAVWLWRQRFTCTLIQRLRDRAGINAHPPPPAHPPRCEQPGCVHCLAIRIHRDALELLLNVNPQVPRRYLWP